VGGTSHAWLEGEGDPDIVTCQLWHVRLAGQKNII
jgi:hypothetical protein